MNKFLSVVLLIGFIVTPIKVGADVTPAVQPSSQTSQVAADTPQSSYVPAATTYQNTDSIPVSIAKWKLWIAFWNSDTLTLILTISLHVFVFIPFHHDTDIEQSGLRFIPLLELHPARCCSTIREPIFWKRIFWTSTRRISDSDD